MATTNQRLERIEAMLEHLHGLQHLSLQLQGVSKQRLEEILATQKDSSEWESLVMSLRKDTDAAAASLKANQ